MFDTINLLQNHLQEELNRRSTVISLMAGSSPEDQESIKAIIKVALSRFVEIKPFMWSNSILNAIITPYEERLKGVEASYVRTVLVPILREFAESDEYFNLRIPKDLDPLAGVLGQSPKPTR